MYKVRKIALLAGSFSSALLLAGCSSDARSPGQTRQTTQKQSPPTSTTTMPTTTTTSAPPRLLTKSASFSWQYSRGYDATGEIQLGTIQPITQMSVAGVSLGGACGADLETSAVIPWELSVTNTTPQFSFSALDPQVQLSAMAFTNNYFGTIARTTSGGLITTKFEAGNSVQCSNNGNDGLSQARWSLSNLGSGQIANLGGFFIIGNYTGPNQPVGSASEIDNLAIDIESEDGQDNGAQPVLPQGSSLTVVPGLQAATNGVALPLDQAQSTNCSVMGNCASNPDGTLLIAPSS